MTRAERGPLSELRATLVRSAGGTVIEVGAGTGLNFRHYSAGATVIATEPDLAMLERAGPRTAAAGARILLVAADAEALPFRDGVFSEGIVGFAMCTIPHPDLALREIRRVLAHGTQLRLLEHVRSASPIVGRIQDVLTPAWKRVAGGCHLNRRTTALIVSSGFSIDSIEDTFGGNVQQIVARS